MSFLHFFQGILKERRIFLNFLWNQWEIFFKKPGVFLFLYPASQILSWFIWLICRANVSSRLYRLQTPFTANNTNDSPLTSAQDKRAGQRFSADKKENPDHTSRDKRAGHEWGRWWGREVFGHSRLVISDTGQCCNSGFFF